MRIKLTKNSSIILATVILVLSIALGYLVWRVNQKETTAPTDSLAEGEGTYCDTGSQCTEITCYWPYVSYCESNACTCKTVTEQRSLPYPCTDTSPACTPEGPGGNYELCCTYNDCDDPDCQDGSPNTVEAVCKTTCDSCNNPYFYQTRYKLIEEEEPICGDGIVGNTTGEECDPPGGACTKDSKPGVCSSTCTCNLNPYCGDGILAAGEECENGDPTGVKCSWSTCNQTGCLCLPAGLNISKSVVESCVDEGTENPKSQLVYTITVRNTGSGNGQISKIEDVLDSKVVSGGITPTDITGGGIYSSGKILWSFSPALSIVAGGTQTYSYKILIDKNNFGTYNNTVTLTPVSGDTIQATANIPADCLVTIPQTGIFDSTLGRISVGFVLLIIGGVVYNLPSGFLIPKNDEKKFRYRVRFESRMSRK